MKKATPPRHSRGTSLRRSVAAKPSTRSRSPRSNTRRSALVSSTLSTARKVLRTEAEAIASLVSRVDANFARAVHLLASTKGRVIVTGMGKSGLIAAKIAATLSSTGTPSFFLHPAEAVHGDLGKLVKGDTVVALSYSGETYEIFRLVERIKRLGLPLIAITGNCNSTLAQASNVALDVSIAKEACPWNLAPTASTTASLALGDALALALLDHNGFREHDFAELHPGGELGRRLKRVEQLMHPARSIATVRPDTPMRRVIRAISRAVRPDGRSFGVAVVVEKSGRLLGILTDGDLRRLLESKDNLLDEIAEACMVREPVTIAPHEPAARGLNIMQSRKLIALPVVDERGRLQGLLHLHDLWSAQLV